MASEGMISSKLIKDILVSVGIPLFLFICFMVYRQIKKAREKRYEEVTDLRDMPEDGPRAGYVGRIAETDRKTFVELDELTRHVLVAGATGSGKTVASQAIVEEALERGVSAVVFDPTAQWSGFLRPNKDAGMFRLYGTFGMNKNDSRAFKGNIYTVTNPNETINVMKHVIPGGITIFCLNRLDPKDIETIVENSVKEVFRANLPESKELKLMIVYEEVHRLLPKFGGRGSGFIQVERACREFRKWGIGLVLVSQVLSDFVGEIKANIGTEIQMRTRYEDDLNRVRAKYGEQAQHDIIKVNVGTGMVQNGNYNRGKPYFVSFRPLKHNHSRLSDEELAKYNNYNAVLDELKTKVDEMKRTKDVFELEIELGLVRDNLMKGSFDVVDMYLETLKPKILEEYDKK